jgi:hypothetical protein
MTGAASSFSTFKNAEFAATYPVARIELTDPRFPLTATIQVVNPMSPGDVRMSSLPTGMITFSLHNTGPLPLHGTLAGSLLNAVGWDWITPIEGHTPGLGGNANRLVRGRGWTRVMMTNPALAEDARLAGSMVLAADDESAVAMPRCAGLGQLRAFLESRAISDGRSRLALAPAIADPQLNAPKGGQGLSPQGKSWLGIIGVPFALEPDESRQIRFAITWHFPNRMVDWEQFGRPIPQLGSSSLYLGNHYALRYLDALDAQLTVERRWSEFVDRTLNWTNNLSESSLSQLEAERLAMQAAYVRSPTCFMGADGRFYGYEGSLGASTRMWSGQFGGSCPMNCTHVWQYEAALAGLWPALERDMRDTEFDVMQAADGSIPHRLRPPAYLPQMTNEPIGGPEEPALDGMLATILKSLRDLQRGAERDWLVRRWPALVKLYRHIAGKWDTTGDGVLRGVQPSTHDIDLAGANPFMGSLWLAALRAMTEMARMMSDDVIYADADGRFTRGTVAYDELLFDGKHYVQVLDATDSRDFQWLSGVLSDQVIGQWWAHQLGLGYILPRQHVRSALKHVVRSNLRRGFAGFEHPYRVYADSAEDCGLLMCSWPDGGRPAVPTRYADEVWTGVEWQVGAHCLFEGLEDEARAVLGALWTRHNGERRNPFNEIECGDHYVRAMSGWTLLQARSGVRVDHTSGVIHVSKTGRWPVVAATGWGYVEVGHSHSRARAVEGTLDLEIKRA